MIVDPQTPAEWREAVDLAAFWLAADAAIQYGFVRGPEIDVERCCQIIERGTSLGYLGRPLPELLREFIR